MTDVSTLRAELSSLQAPEELTRHKAWLMWRYEDSNQPGDKPRKVPYYVSGQRRFGENGNPADLDKLATFEQARRQAAKRGFDGVGFAALPQFGIVALDFDKCMEPSGRIFQQVEALCAGTYSEISPSGNGVRAFFKGYLKDVKANAKEKKSLGYGFEVFSSKLFVTFTGRTTPGCDLFGCEDTVADLPESLRLFYDTTFAGRKEKTGSSPVDKAGLQLNDCRLLLNHLPVEVADDYDEWLHVGMALHHEFDASADAFDAWDDWSLISSKYSCREDNMAKWESFGRNEGEIITARTLIKLGRVHGFGLVSSPVTESEFDDLIPPVAKNTDSAGQRDAVEIEKPARFELTQAGNHSTDFEVAYHIEGLFPKGGLILVYGEPGSGKSFFVLDTALAVAGATTTWRDHYVEHGRVIYIVAEGAVGFNKRLAAYAQANKVDLRKVDLHFITEKPNLLSSPDILDLCKSITLMGTTAADLIVIDTFAQSTPGANENSSDDMGQALSHCRKLQEVTRATILLVHHSGKDASKGARGWSGLRGAADAEVEISRHEALRVARITKQKDDVDQGAFAFQLMPVEIATDKRGNPVTSCVAVPCAFEDAEPLPAKLGPDQQKYFTAFEACELVSIDGAVSITALKEELRKESPKFRGDVLKKLCEGPKARLTIVEIDGVEHYRRKVRA